MAAARAGASWPSPASLDQPGPFARTVEDSALLLQAMSGHDPKDSDLGAAAGAGLRRRGAQSRHQGPEGRHPEGIPGRRHVEEIVALWAKGMEMLKAAGAEPVEVSLPHTKYALPAYYIVAPAECSSQPGALRRRALRPARAGQET